MQLRPGRQIWSVGPRPRVSCPGQREVQRLQRSSPATNDETNPISPNSSGIKRGQQIDEGQSRGQRASCWLVSRPTAPSRSRLRQTGTDRSGAARVTVREKIRDCHKRRPRKSHRINRSFRRGLAVPAFFHAFLNLGFLHRLVRARACGMGMIPARPEAIRSLSNEGT